jgi:hypothetical protein
MREGNGEKELWLTNECKSRFSLQWSSRTTQTRDVAFTVYSGMGGLQLDQNPSRAVFSFTAVSNRRKKGGQ